MECIIVNKFGAKNNTLDCEYVSYPYGEQGVVQYQPVTDLQTHQAAGYISMITANLTESVDLLIAVDSKNAVSLKTVMDVQHARHEFITSEQQFYCRIEFETGSVKYESGYIVGARTDTASDGIWKSTIDELKSVQLTSPDESKIKSIAAKHHKRDEKLELNR